MTKTVYGNFRPLLRESQKYKRHTKGTYIGLVAHVIQDSPNKMLTFKQIMNKLGVFVTGDRKGLENNIRVCLSSNNCFVKVPIDPEYPNAKRNFWRVDQSSITPKMLRRHFSDKTEHFTGLLPAGDRKSAPPSALSSPGTSIKTEDQQIKSTPIKFTGPFSIESLLKKDNHPQVQITVQKTSQTVSSNFICFSDRFYSRTLTTDSACLDQENRHQGLIYMYRSIEEASGRKLRMELSPELNHALLYSPHFTHDCTVVTKMSSFPQNAHFPYDHNVITALSSSLPKPHQQT